MEWKDTGEDIGEEQTPAANTSDARVASSVGPDADEAEQSQAKEWNADWGLGGDQFIKGPGSIIISQLELKLQLELQLDQRRRIPVRRGNHGDL